MYLESYVDTSIYTLCFQMTFRQQKSETISKITNVITRSDRVNKDFNSKKRCKIKF